MKRKVLAVMLILISVFAICIGCGTNQGGSRNAEGGKTDVRVAYFPNITHTQALFLKNQGIIEKALGAETNVTWTAFNAGPAEVEAIFAGEIDLGYIGPVPAISANVKSDGDVSIIAGATNGGTVLVSGKDVSISSVTELSGLKVAVPQLGNTQHLSLLQMLSENNMKTSTNGGDVELIAAANADIKTMMDNGQINAALVPEPWGSILQNDISANVVLDYKDIWRDGDYSAAVVIVNNDFGKKHLDIVEKFLQAHKDATVYINENLEEAKEIVNKEIQEATNKSFDQTILDSAFNRLIISETIPVESIWDFANLSKEEEFIHKLPSEDTLIDQTYLEKLQ